MLDPSAYADSFARDNLPPPELWPALEADLRNSPIRNGSTPRRTAGPHGRERVRGTAVHSFFRRRGVELRGAARQGESHRRHIGGRDGCPTGQSRPVARRQYADAGGVLVRGVEGGRDRRHDMPLLRARELGYVLDKARIGFALCDASLAEELTAAKAAQAFRTVYFHTDAADGLEARMARRSVPSSTSSCRTTNVAVIGFTSGTTVGQGHDAFPSRRARDLRSVPALDPETSGGRYFFRHAALGFTFGLGGMLLFPMRFGASTLLLERATPDSLLEAVGRHRVTTLFAPPPCIAP